MNAPGATERLTRYGSIALTAAETAEPHYDDPVLRSTFGDQPLASLTPSFYGCFDWHSAVHSHWTMMRILNVGAPPTIADRLVVALDRALQTDQIAIESRTIGRCPDFELPYGLAWLLTFDAELARSRRDEAPTWRESLRPLAVLAADRLHAWLGELIQPDELGLHSNTAFAMGLIDRWAVSTSSPMVDLVHERAIEWWEDPTPRSLYDEPKQHDFLSPALTVADLMSKVLDSGPFAVFLDDWIPGLNSELDSLTPVDCPDPSNGRLSHLQGLNLSRAGMMRSIASSLGDTDERTNGLLRAADQHFAAGDAAVTGEHFAGAHWLPTFALMAMGFDLVD